MLRFILICLLLFVVGGFDIVTGREVRVGSLYLLVVATASWNLRPRALLLHVALTSAVWQTAEWMNGVHYPKTWQVYWNVCNRMGVIILTASMVYKARTTVEEQQRLIRELGQSLLKISRFKEMVPVCRLCHELHLAPEYNVRLAEILDEGADADTVGDICDTCFAARQERVANIPVEEYFQAAAGDAASAPADAAPAARSRS